MSTTGVLIYYDHPIWAFILLWISGYLDTVDGTMARQQRQSSAWGTVQDITFDRIVELSVIVGLATKFPEVQFMLLLLTASIVLSMTIRHEKLLLPSWTCRKNRRLYSFLLHDFNTRLVMVDDRLVRYYRAVHGVTTIYGSEKGVTQ